VAAISLFQRELGSPAASPVNAASGPVSTGLNLTASTSSSTAAAPRPASTASAKQVSRWFLRIRRLTRSSEACVAESCYIKSTQ
jgi:hypothetical protein